MTPPSAARAKSAGIAAALAVFGLAFWELRMVRPVPLPQAVTKWAGDLYSIYYPGFRFAYRGADFLPSWNPLQMAGAPFLAGYNGGFLYPPNWLAAIVPVHLALGWVCALHVALAGVTTFALGRFAGLTRPAAAVAALTFMLSERFLGEGYRPSYLASITWVPIVCLCAARLVVAPTPWRGALLGVAVALQFLTGIAQHVCYEAYLLVLAGAVVWTRTGGWNGDYVRRLAIAGGLAAAVALGLSAVQLFPTLEVIAAAVRGPAGLTLAQTYPIKTGESELRQLVYVFGPVLGFAALALVERTRRPWVDAAIVILVVAMLIGIGSPFYTRVFYHLPGVALFRMPMQMEMVGTLPLALLAGLGVDVALRVCAGWPAGARAVVGVVLGVVGALSVTPFLMGTSAAVLVLVVTVLLLVYPSRRTAWLVVATLACERLVAVESRVMITQNNTAAFFEPPAFVRFLSEHAGHDRVLVVKNWRRRFPFMEKLGTLWGVHVAQDYEPLVAVTYHRFLRPLESSNVDKPLFAGRYQPRPNDPGWRALDLLAVRWVVVAAGRPWTPSGDRFRVAYQDREATVWENTKSAPRAYLAERWRVMPNADFALSVLQGGGIDPRAQPSIDRPDPVRLDPQAPGEADVRIVGETNDTVHLRVAAPRGGLVVLADLFWPGWRVTVDGAERSMLRVDYLFRGVMVEPGEHDVVFRYVPLRLYVGAATTGATVVALAMAGLAVALDRRRRDPRLGAA